MTNFNKLRSILKRVFYIAVTIAVLVAPVFYFSGCKQIDDMLNPSESPTEEQEPQAKQPEQEPDPPPTVVSEPQVSNVVSEKITLSFITDSGILHFYDGEDFYIRGNANPVNCGVNCYTNNNILTLYDGLGQITTTENLVKTPDFAITDGPDIYTVEKLSPETAFAMGGKATAYTKIYKNNTEFMGDFSWATNEYEATSFIKTDSDDLILIDTNGGFHSASGTINGINHAMNLLIHNFDNGSKTAAIRDANTDNVVSWVSNYFSEAKEWQFIGDRWISQNGYEYYNGILHENANSMWGNNTLVSESPVFIAAGTSIENSETVSYWIECNDGILYKFVKSTDEFGSVARIYWGDGNHTYGVTESKILKPVIIGEELFFNHSDSIWKMDLVRRAVVPFYAGHGQVVGWL